MTESYAAILKLTSSSESIHQKFIDVEIHAPRADVVDDDDEVMNKNNVPWSVGIATTSGILANQEAAYFGVRSANMASFVVGCNFYFS